MPDEQSGFTRFINGAARVVQAIPRVTRNVVQAIPGGAQTFPLETHDDGSQSVNWWPGRPGQGPTAAGAMVRGAIDPTGMVLDGEGDDPISLMRDAGRTISTLGRGIRDAFRRPGSSSGSVVGRGFIGPPDPRRTIPTQGPSQNFFGRGVGQMPQGSGFNMTTRPSEWGPPSQSQPPQNWGPPSQAEPPQNWGPPAPGAAGASGSRGGPGRADGEARLGAGQTFGSEIAMREMMARMASRGGLLAER